MNGKTCMYTHWIKNHRIIFLLQARQTTMEFMNTFGLTHGLLGRFFKSNNKKHEDTPCSTIPVLNGFHEVCNLTSMNTDTEHYCGPPSKFNLNCSDWKESNCSRSSQRLMDDELVSFIR